MDFDYDNYNYPINPPLLPPQQHNNNNNNPSSQSMSSNDLLTTYRCVLLNYPTNITSSSSSATLNYYTLWLVTTNPIIPPTDFTPIHHIVYQVSQLLLLLYLLVARNSLVTLCLLLCYSVLQVLWGLVIMKSIDIFTWSALLGVVCGVKVCSSVCRSWWGARASNVGGNCGGIKSNAAANRRRSGSSKGGVGSSNKALLFSPGKNMELEQVYARLFAPVRVSYKQFLKVVGCKRGFKLLACGENYAVEKKSRVDSLGLLVSGRLVVSQGGKALHVILPFQFVDSPEYFGVATDELFQVTITALEESKLLVWHRDKLRLTIMNDEFLRVMFDHIIGRDVVRKLIQVSDSIMTTPTTTSTTLSLSGTPNQSTTSSYQTSTASASSALASSSSSSNGSSSSAPASNLLTTLSSQQPHGNNTTTTTTTAAAAAAAGPPPPPPLQQPIIVVRKDKYAYQPTYLHSLSEEQICGNKGSMDEDEEEEDVDDEEDDDDDDDDEDEEEGVLQGDGIISGNEKEPMLDENNSSLVK